MESGQWGLDSDTSFLFFSIQISPRLKRRQLTHSESEIIYVGQLIGEK